jgi:predicted ferric reductase
VKALKVFLVLGVILFPIIPLWDYLAIGDYIAQPEFYPIEGLFASFTLGIWLGIPAFIYFQAVLLMSARIRWLDRIFAHDKVMKFHGTLAIVALLLGFMHRYFKVNYSYVSDAEGVMVQLLLGDLGFWLIALIMVITLVVMVPGFPHKLKFMARFRIFLTQKWGWDYSILKIVHNFTVLGIQILAIHVILASTTQESYFRLFLMGGISVLTTVLWVLHKIIRPIKLRLNPSEVLEVLTPAQGHTEVVLSKPRGFRSKSGQFVFVRFPGSQANFGEHPYTLSSGGDDEHLRITAKHLGDFSASMAQLKNGDLALVDGPYGKFYPQPESKNQRPLVCIAGGIGITPFLSFLSNWNKDDSRKLILFWAVRSPADVVHREFFQNKESEIPNFRWVPIVQNDPWDGALEGFFDQTKVQSVLSPEGISLSEAEVYFCGPGGMQKAVFPILKESGVKGGRLHFEQFSMG